MLLVGVGDGGGGDEALRVGVQRAGEDGVGGPLLDEPAAVQDRDAVGDLADDGEVVRDEQAREAEPRPQVGQQVQDPRLHGHVERARGLVGDEEVRPEGDGTGDGDALTLTAGQLVGEPLAAAAGRATASSSPATRSRTSRGPSEVCSSRGSATESATLERGSSEE